MMHMYTRSFTCTYLRNAIKHERTRTYGALLRLIEYSINVYSYLFFYSVQLAKQASQCMVPEIAAESDTDRHVQCPDRLDA